MEACLKRELELVCSLAVQHELERALAPELFRADRAVRSALAAGDRHAAVRTLRELRSLRNAVGRRASGARTPAHTGDAGRQSVLP